MSEPLIALRQVSKWYGQVIGVSEIDLVIERGIVALLGPNGAGKSTLIKLLAGLLRPSRGKVTVRGKSVTRYPEARALIGYCPEHEGVYGRLTGLEFVTMMASLSGLPRARARDAAAEALTSLGLEEAMERPIGGYSKGMRQRAKLAQTLVHDPALILLDEPLTGCDPVARANIIRTIEALGQAGKVVLVSSHILHEVAAMTEEIVLIHQGRIRAQGNQHAIRALIDQHPHRIRVVCDQPRALAGHLLGEAHIVRIGFEPDAVVFETHAPDACYDLLARTLVDSGIQARDLSSPDNDLAAVFEYLTETAGGGART